MFFIKKSNKGKITDVIKSKTSPDDTYSEVDINNFDEFKNAENFYIEKRSELKKGYYDLNSYRKYVRKKRDQKIGETIWMYERHKQEKELKMPTTLSDEKLEEWLAYWQTLREFPDSITKIPKNAEDIRFPDPPDL